MNAGLPSGARRRKAPPGVARPSAIHSQRGPRPPPQSSTLGVGRRDQWRFCPWHGRAGEYVRRLAAEAEIAADLRLPVLKPLHDAVIRPRPVHRAQRVRPPNAGSAPATAATEALCRCSGGEGRRCRPPRECWPAEALLPRTLDEGKPGKDADPRPSERAWMNEYPSVATRVEWRERGTPTRRRAAPPRYADHHQHVCERAPAASGAASTTPIIVATQQITLHRITP